MDISSVNEAERHNLYKLYKKTGIIYQNAQTRGVTCRHEWWQVSLGRGVAVLFALYGFILPCQSAKTPGRTLRPSRKKPTQSLGLLQPINSRVSWALHRSIRRIAESDGPDRPSLLREN